MRRTPCLVNVLKDLTIRLCPKTPKTCSPPPVPLPKRYTAKDIEVLEGLEPVRRRPGMYIGGTDISALHHLAAEILDNAMDEAVAGHASRIEMELGPDNVLTVRDNGRGMPVDPHPKFKNKSALEVIMTTLHAGGKFDGKAYETSGGLHGVGASVVNALSEWMEVDVARDKRGHKMRFERGEPKGKLKELGAVNRRGTIVAFKPDVKIFGDVQFSPARLYRMAKSKAYLFRGVEIRWACDPALIKDETPAEDTLKFPGGLLDFLKSEIGKSNTINSRDFAGRTENKDGRGAVEWAVAWTPAIDPFVRSYCNTIPTPQGGTHEQGLRNALTKALRAHGERANNRKTAPHHHRRCDGGRLRRAVGLHPRAGIPGPDQGQALKPRRPAPGRNGDARPFRSLAGGKPRRSRQAAGFRHRSGRRPASQAAGKGSLAQGRDAQAAPARQAGRLHARRGARAPRFSWSKAISAGGSAKQARDRATQAILPLRGKILNVASAGAGKLQQNQELSDLVQALGCGTGAKYREDDLRYERVIVMTDADVDGAHIASLLLTFFYREMPELIARRPSLSSPCRRFIVWPRAPRRSMPATMPTANVFSKANSAPMPRWRFRASRAWAK